MIMFFLIWDTDTLDLYSAPGHTGSAICRSDGDSDVRRSLFVRRPPDSSTQTDRRFPFKTIRNLLNCKFSSKRFSNVPKTSTGRTTHPITDEFRRGHAVNSFLKVHYFRRRFTCHKHLSGVNL